MSIIGIGFGTPFGIKHVTKSFRTSCLDMSKAFNTVPLKQLCCKLSHYGIRGCALKWIENLLAGRTKQVVVNGEYSGPTTVYNLWSSTRHGTLANYYSFATLMIFPKI